MQKSTPFISAIFILLVMIVCSACVSQPANQTSQENSRLTQISEPVESPYIDFDRAQQNLPAYNPDPVNDSAFFKTVYSVIGTDVDGSGNARSWIFGVRHPDGTVMIAYDGYNWIHIPWKAPPGREEIALDSIVSPARLFSQNKGVIAGDPLRTTPERRDLELKQGVYTLTITSNNTVRILTFNATTGELIPQP